MRCRRKDGRYLLMLVARLHAGSRAPVGRLWLNLQNLYELRLAEAKNGKAIKKLLTLKHSAEA